MSENNAGLTPIELLQRRLNNYQGRMVAIYALIDREGQPQVVAIQDIGKAERLSKKEKDSDDVVDLRG